MPSKISLMLEKDFSEAEMERLVSKVASQLEIHFSESKALLLKGSGIAFAF